MNWKDIITQNPEFNEKDLKMLLFSLLESKNKKIFSELCIKFKPVIVENFQSWKNVPEQLRNDSEAVSRYATGLIAIANLFEDNGDSQFLDILEDKNNSNNPILLWESMFFEAQKCKDTKKYFDAIRILEELVAKMKSSKGTAVINYLPMVYGALGENYFFSQRYDLAYDITLLALEKCQETSDVEGVISYSGNLSEICKKLNKENETINWVIIATNLMLQTGKTEEAINIRSHYNIEPLSDLITIE